MGLGDAVSPSPTLLCFDMAAFDMTANHQFTSRGVPERKKEGPALSGPSLLDMPDLAVEPPNREVVNAARNRGCFT